MVTLAPIYQERAFYSQTRLNELKNRIGSLSEISAYTDLTVFGAGSLGRLEASEYSDIDLFLLCKGEPDNLAEPHTSELRLFGSLIDTVEKMGFPKFSNDCEYLKILHSPQILENMGKPADDHENYFTVRMLLLLESTCLFGQVNYDDIVREMVSSYFRDYPDHKKSFQPVFLLNDICRFWKTLLMNYESRRGGTHYTEEQKTKQKVRNFKLKFSRMTTCFATVASICSYNVPVTEDQVVEQTGLTPRQRLESIPTRVPEAEKEVQDVLDRYAFFLEKTGLATNELEGHFSDKTKRAEMFRIANDFGHSMYTLLRSLDTCHGDSSKFLRYLVI